MSACCRFCQQTHHYFIFQPTERDSTALWLSACYTNVSVRFCWCSLSAFYEACQRTSADALYHPFTKRVSALLLMLSIILLWNASVRFCWCSLSTFYEACVAVSVNTLSQVRVLESKVTSRGSAYSGITQTSVIYRRLQLLALRIRSAMFRDSKVIFCECSQ